MAENPQIEDEKPDEGLTRIVSYLDGELDDTQMNEVELDLINDPEMRSHADILSRTWAMLDQLDDVSASRQFTQETLATVALETQKDEDTDSSRGAVFRRLKDGLARYKVLPCFLAGMIGGGIGLFTSSIVREQRQANGSQAATRIVLENFELVRDADVYSVVPSLQDLQKLNLPTAATIDESSRETP